MRIRTTLPAFIIASLLCLVAGIFFTADFFVGRTFTTLEEHAVKDNFKRVEDILADNLAGLSSQTGDWAGWDESCDFIETGNPAFIKRNLPDKTFAELRLSMIMFVHATGRIVFERWFDQKEGKASPSPISFRKHIGLNSRLLSHNSASSSQSGIILLPEGPLLMVSRPIVTTERTGPIRGSLIMARFLDSVEIDRLAKAARISFAVARSQDPQMPADFNRIQPSLKGDKSFIISPLSGEEIAGYGMIKDIYGDPALMLRIDMTRDIKHRGENALRLFKGAVAVIGLAYGAGLLLALWLLLPHQAGRGLPENAGPANDGVPATKPDAGIDESIAPEQGHEEAKQEATPGDTEDKHDSPAAPLT